MEFILKALSDFYFCLFQFDISEKISKVSVNSKCITYPKPGPSGLHTGNTSEPTCSKNPDCSATPETSNQVTMC